MAESQTNPSNLREWELWMLMPKRKIQTRIMNYRALIKAIHSARQAMKGRAENSTRMGKWI